MRKVPLPGTYGRVCYDGLTSDAACIVKLTGYEHNSEDLRETAHFFNQLAEILDASAMRQAINDPSVTIRHENIGYADHKDVIEYALNNPPAAPIIRHSYRVSLWHHFTYIQSDTFEYEDEANAWAKALCKRYANMTGYRIKCRKVRLT